jgi:hypothetical protein
MLIESNFNAFLYYIAKKLIIIFDLKRKEMTCFSDSSTQERNLYEGRTVKGGYCTKNKILPKNGILHES